MSKEIFFSIILPVYKEKKETFLKCINSISCQTFKDFELILVVDNPHLEYLNEIDTLLFQIKNKKVIINSKNLGITKSLNIGIKSSIGKYIVRQDADDYSLEKRLENAHAVLSKENILIYSTPAKVKNLIKPHFIIRNLFTEDILKFKNILFHGALIIKRELIMDYLYNENFKFSQDFELYNRLIKNKHKIYYDLKNISYVSSPSEGSITKTHPLEQMSYFNKIVDNNNYGFTRNILFKQFRLDLVLVLFFSLKSIIFKVFNGSN